MMQELIIHKMSIVIILLFKESLKYVRNNTNMNQFFIIIVFLLAISTPLLSQNFNGTIISKSYYFNYEETPQPLKTLSHFLEIPIELLDTITSITHICKDTLVTTAKSEGGDIVSKSLQIGKDVYLYNSREYKYFKPLLLPDPQELFEKKDFIKQENSAFEYEVKNRHYKSQSIEVNLFKHMIFPSLIELKGKFSTYFNQMGSYKDYLIKTDEYKNLRSYKYQKENVVCSEIMEFGILDTSQIYRVQDSIALSGFNSKVTSDDVTQLPKCRVYGLNGNVQDIYDYLGEELTIIDFWATWCEPCLKEFEYLNDLWNKYKSKGLNVISLSIDEGNNSFNKIIDIKTQKSIKWPIFVVDDGIKSDFCQQLNIKQIPHIILLNKEGKLINANCPLASNDNLDNLISSILNNHK